jgi:hypothetical protein
MVATAKNSEDIWVIQISYPEVFLPPSIRPRSQKFRLRKQGLGSAPRLSPERGDGMSQSYFDALATGPEYPFSGSGAPRPRSGPGSTRSGIATVASFTPHVRAWHTGSSGEAVGTPHTSEKPCHRSPERRSVLRLRG